jgi:CRP-like cAMP-binding protein
MSEVKQDLAPLLLKLEKHASFDQVDRKAFLSLTVSRKTIPAGGYVARQGDPVHVCTGLLSGFAYTHKTLWDGARQIVSVHVSGDLLNLQDAMFATSSHNVQIMTPAVVASIQASELIKIASERPVIQRALWLSTLVDGAVFSEWITNVGRRDARSRIAHLLCEFAMRLKAIGLCTDLTYTLPMTQEQIADATGLTPVHVNRTMQALRHAGLIRTDKRAITIDDWDELTRTAGFNVKYLHQGAILA